MLKYATPYDGLRKEKSDITSVKFLDKDGELLNPSRTKQCHKDECDINNIVKKYDKHGLLTHVNNAIAQYGDYSEINEFLESQLIVKKAEQSFSEIPSEIRAKFKNNAGEFFEFANNPANIDELVNLGLAHKPEIVENPKENLQVKNEETPPKAASE